jgi:hypothetical protein
MQAIRLAALTVLILSAGCTTAPLTTAMGAPTTVVDATPSIGPSSGVPPARAAVACSSITHSQGGGAAYLDCLARQQGE